MQPQRFIVDFNELVERDLVLLSVKDERLDAEGNTVFLYEGLEVMVLEVEFDEDGRPDNLFATGVVERNSFDYAWCAHVKWCCRIDDSGIRYESAVK